MQSSNELIPDTPQSSLEISPEILVSLATGPLLLALLGSKALSRMMQEIGQQSEELFRGDRLPLLDFPRPPTLDKL
jgi:hypothetical protein